MKSHYIFILKPQCTTIKSDILRYDVHDDAQLEEEKLR